MTDSKPYLGHKRKPGTGCISEINDHLYEGRYSSHVARRQEACPECLR